MVDTDTTDQDGTQYVVRVGGENLSTVKEAVVTVTTTETGTTVEYTTIYGGDVDKSGNVTVTDAGYILGASVYLDYVEYIDTYYNNERGTEVAKKVTKEDGSDYYKGDVDKSGSVTVTDAGYILGASVYLDYVEYIDTYYNNDRGTQVASPISIVK